MLEGHQKEFLFCVFLCFHLRYDLILSGSDSRREGMFKLCKHVASRAVLSSTELV
jgi:hypothetical protein